MLIMKDVYVWVINRPHKTWYSATWYSQAYMTWLCAIMTWLCAIMTWLCAIMTWLCAIMTIIQFY